MSHDTINKKIFLVEDDAYCSRMYERAFRLRGYAIEVVASGKSAFEKLQEIASKPDIIITDAILPEMNGKELILALKQDEKLRSVPIVVLTNSFSKEDAAQFLALGAEAYLVKIEHDARDVVKKIELIIKKYSI